MYREVNYKSSLRNYNSNHNYSNSMSFNGNNLTHNFSMTNNNFNKLENVNNNDKDNLPNIQGNGNKREYTHIKNTNIIKEANLLKFVRSKNKIKQRLQLMSREKSNMTNSSLGKRVIIKDLKNTIIDDGMSKTTKGLNMN